MFDYYSVGSYVYFGLLIMVFGVNLIRVKNRSIYIGYLLGRPWHMAFIRVFCIIALTLLTLTTSPILGCFVMTCIIQAIVRHHYNYLNEYYRAQSTIIIPYNFELDRDLSAHRSLPV